MARGHRVENIPELPLVIDGLKQTTTKSLLNVLNSFGVGDELRKVRRSKKVRTGVGKYRNSRYVMRKGPLIVFGDESKEIK